jgi:hypothetical protein
MNWVVYHVEGHTTAGCFFSNHFDNFEDAASYWGSPDDWQDGEFALERGDGRTREVIILWRKGF